MPNNSNDRTEAMERAAEVRAMVAKNQIYYYQLADALGIHYATLRRWVRSGVREDRYQKIMEAIGNMIGGEANA